MADDNSDRLSVQMHSLESDLCRASHTHGDAITLRMKGIANLQISKDHNGQVGNRFGSASRPYYRQPFNNRTSSGSSSTISAPEPLRPIRASRSHFTSTPSAVQSAHRQSNASSTDRSTHAFGASQQPTNVVSGWGNTVSPVTNTPFFLSDPPVRLTGCTTPNHNPYVISSSSLFSSKVNQLM